MTIELTNHRIEIQALRREIQFVHLACISEKRELAYMLAHEMIQPLMVISAYVNGCIRRMEENTDNRMGLLEAMKAVEKQVVRTGNMIHSVKYCVEALELHYAPMHLQQVLEETILLLREDLKNFPVNIQYHMAKLPLLEIDEAQIKLVLLCLLRNSLEELTDAKISQPNIIIETTIINGFNCQIRITDNGRGIPENIKSKLFHARVSTKPNKLGMSLITCKNIMIAHQGHINVVSPENGGASFELVLPILRVP